jgi:hypothetical protein
MLRMWKTSPVALDEETYVDREVPSTVIELQPLRCDGVMARVVKLSKSEAEDLVVDQG